jgi:putative endonuclease
MKSPSWFVYIIENEKGLFYTGITTDVERRFKEHGTSKKGAKFFRTSPPKTVLFTKKFLNRSEASKYEAMLKKLSRSEKLKILRKAA